MKYGFILNRHWDLTDDVRVSFVMTTSSLMPSVFRVVTQVTRQGENRSTQEPLRHLARIRWKLLKFVLRTRNLVHYIRAFLQWPQCFNAALDITLNSSRYPLVIISRDTSTLSCPRCFIAAQNRLSKSSYLSERSCNIGSSLVPRLREISSNNGSPRLVKCSKASFPILIPTISSNLDEVRLLPSRTQSQRFSLYVSTPTAHRQSKNIIRQ